MALPPAQRESGTKWLVCCCLRLSLLPLTTPCVHALTLHPHTRARCRSLPPLLEPEHLSTLPPQEELEAAARSETSDVERVLLDSFSSGSASGAQAQALAAQLMADLEAAGGVETDGAQLRLPASLREWYEQAGGALAQMSPTTLALMSKFVRLKLRYSAEDVEDVRTKLQVLLRHVQAALAAAGGSASTDGGGAQPPLWSRLHGRPGGVLTDPEQGSLDFDKLAVLLGEEQAAEFAGWAQAVALNQEGAALQPYELFAQEQLSMDLQRYLAMEADPKLHLAIEGPPSPWRDPRPLAASPEEFLEASRGLVNTYLAASELRPMSALEWETYKVVCVCCPANLLPRCGGLHMWFKCPAAAPPVPPPAARPALLRSYVAAQSRNALDVVVAAAAAACAAALCPLLTLARTARAPTPP